MCELVDIIANEHVALAFLSAAYTHQVHAPKFSQIESYGTFDRGLYHVQYCFFGTIRQSASLHLLDDMIGR